MKTSSLMSLFVVVMVAIGVGFLLAIGFSVWREHQQRQEQRHEIKRLQGVVESIEGEVRSLRGSGR